MYKSEKTYKDNDDTYIWNTALDLSSKSTKGLFF